MDVKNRVITMADIAEENLRKGIRLNSALYFDRPRAANGGEFGDGLDKYNSSVVVAAGSQKWNQSAGFDKLWTDIEKQMKKLNASIDKTGGIKVNAAQFASDYYDLINMFRLDLTRRRVEEADFTSIVAQEIVNPAISRSAAVDEFLPFAGAFEEFKGRGESINMMEHTTGDTTTVTQKMYALGDARTLEDALYNLDIYSVMKVMDAYVRAHRAKRNDLLFAPILGATWTGTGAKQAVAADSTGGTYDEKLYLTINAGIEAARVLKDPQTGLPIDASRLTLVCAYENERAINRVINGQLDNSKGKAINLQPLNEVTRILPYRGDSIKVGVRTYNYTGVTKNEAYLMVAGADNSPNYVVTKRALTYETGRGDPFMMIRDGQVGYFSQTEYNTEFLGGAGGGTNGDGYIVKMSLPS
jgi:hypothetical protein